MPIFKKPNLDNQSDLKKANPLLGFRFVYKNKKSVIETSVELSLKKLKQDKEIYELRLETEMDLVERENLKQEIEIIDQEIEDLEPIKQSKTPSNVLYGLESNVKEIEEQIEDEKDIGKRQVLESVRLSCLDALVERQKPVKDQMGLEDAIDQINNDNYILKALEKGTFDYLHIEYLLSSDLKPFFDINFQKQLAEAEEQMIIKDNVQNALRPQREDLLIEADEDWFKYKDDASKESDNLKNEKRDVELEMEHLDVNQKRAKKMRLGWLNKFIPHALKQTEKRSDWVHKQVLEKEKKQAKASLLKNVPPEVLNKLKNLVLEARSMRTEKVYEYINVKFGKAKKRFEKIKKAKVFGKSTIEGEVLEIDGETIERRGLQTDFDEFELMLQYSADPSNTDILKRIERDKNISLDEYRKKFEDPAMLKKLAQNLDELDRRTSVSIEDIQQINNNRPEIEKEILEGFSDLKALIDQIKPDELKRLKEELEKNELARIEAVKKGETKDAKTKYDEIKGGSLIYQKSLSAIEELEKPDSELRRKFAKYQEILKNIEDLEPEEIAAIQQELAILSPKLELVRNLNENIEKALSPENDAVKKSNQAIIEIKGALDAEEIKHILNRNIGSDHIEIISHSKFNKEWKEHTEGCMVFRKKGGEWEIIIDESVFNAPLKEIKKQLVHELLHVQFETSDDIKNLFHEQMVEKNSEWPEIKKAFIDWMKSLKPPRKPPGKEGWKDEYVLSELYAMQNEIGHVHRTGDDPKSRLNNLLAGVGVSKMIKDIDGKTTKFIDDKEKVYGYAGGQIDEMTAALGGEEGEASSGSYDEYKIKIEFIDERIKGLKINEFLGYVPGAKKLLGALKDFNSHTKTSNENFKKNPDDSSLGVGIGGRIKSVEDELKNIEKAVSEVSSKAPNLEINPLRALWNNTVFLSANDIVQTLIDLKEFVGRRHEREKKDHAARLGMAIFQGTDLGREAYARQQKAEMEEVQEWQSRYENLDAWELENELKVISRDISPSADRLKAILRLLAQKGRIDWRNKYLWKVLNKLQSAVHLTPDDTVILHDPPLMRQKLHSALGEIWDYDEYLTLERQNESSYDGELRKWLPSYDRIQDLLSDRLDQLLQMHRDGEKVDPMEYESIMVYAIEKGKAFAEQVMFHLMAGMADGLLSPDRGMALDKYLNKWPATQWIYSKSPPLSQADYKRYCQQYFKEDYKAGKIRDGHGAEFMNFYWVHMQNDIMTIQRVRKSVSEREWDHDWTRSIACLGDANTAKRFFSGKSGQQETKDTGVENAYAGAVQWLEENSRKPEKIDFRKHFARHAAWCAMAEGIMDRVAYYRGDTDISTRANENMEREIAREQGTTNHANWTLKDNRSKIRGFLDYLDPQLFPLLRDKKDLRENEEKAEAGLQVKELLMMKYSSRADDWEAIKHIDDVYERMDLIIKTIFESLSDRQLKAILAEMVPAD